MTHSPFTTQTPSSPLWSLRALAIAVCLLLAVVQSPAWAVADKADTATEKLLATLHKMQSFTADFKQRLTDDSGDVLQENQGQTKLSRPGMMIWQTTTPFANLIVANAEVMWRYDADLDQAIRQPIDDKLSQTPALLLTGDAAQIQASYRVAMQPPAEFAVDSAVAAPHQVFSLSPRQQVAGTASMFQQLQLAFDADGVLQAMVILDDLQQRTEIVFSKAQLNPVLEPAEFQFEPPAGVDIIVHE